MLIPRFKLGPSTNGMILISGKWKSVPYRSAYTLCRYTFGDPFFGTHHTKVFTKSVIKVDYVIKA